MALLWKMICNLGDPMSLRHPVQDIQNRFRERNAQLLYKYRHLSNFQIRILIPISVSFLVVCGGRQNPCCELTCKRLSIIALPHKTSCEFYFLALKPSAAACGACVALCCGVRQCVAVCCSILQRVAVCYSVLQWRSRPPPLR